MANVLTPSTITLGKVDAIPIGQGRCYVVGNQEIAVFRQRDGSLFATQSRCPHRQGPLSEGLVGNRKVICPLHAHHFNLETGAGGDPAECIRTFEVSESCGNIVVQL